MKTHTSQKLLSYILEKTQATPKELATFLHISPQALFRHLKKLQQKGQIIKTGKPPRVYYRSANLKGEGILRPQQQVAEAHLPTHFGNFFIHVWSAQQNLEPVALVTPNFDPQKPVLVRIHSECLTGDVLGSLRCDCGEQKEKALHEIARSGNGIFIYLRQEGRGIGLYDKIRSYKLQEEGLDTYDANLKLGHAPDERVYKEAKNILTFFKITKFNLLTNNPDKVIALQKFGFIVERTPLLGTKNKYNIRYLETKKTRFGHWDY